MEGNYNLSALLSPPFLQTQDYFTFPTPSSSNELLFYPPAFSSSDSIDSGMEEYFSDIFSPLNFRDSGDEDLDHTDDDLLSSQFTAKPPPPSYLEHLLLNDSYNYSTENNTFSSNMDFYSFDEQLGKWISTTDDSGYFHTDNGSFGYENHQLMNDITIPSYFSPPPTPHDWQTSHVSCNSSFAAEDEFYFCSQNRFLPSAANYSEVSYASNPDAAEQRDAWIVNRMTNFIDEIPNHKANEALNSNEIQILSESKYENCSRTPMNSQVEGRLRDILNHFGSQNVGSTHAQLWQFLLELLANPELAEGCIHWEGGEGEFRMVDPEEVARKWGNRKRRSRMNFEKMGRALRYYYDKMILKKVTGKKWTYQFNLAGILCQGKKQLQDCLEKFEKSRKKIG